MSNPFPLAPATSFWPLSEDTMQGNLFAKLNEYSPPPKARNTARAPQRALPVEPEILPPTHPSFANNILFDEGDIDQAISIWRASEHLDPKLAMKEVMLHALRCAAINLDVR